MPTAIPTRDRHWDIFWPTRKAAPPAGTLAQVFLMQSPNISQVCEQRFLHRRRQSRDSILLPFAVTNYNLILAKINVLESKLQTFIEAKPGAVEQRCYQLRPALHQADDCSDFLFGQDNRESLWFLRAHGR